MFGSGTSSSSKELFWGGGDDEYILVGFFYIHGIEEFMSSLVLTRVFWLYISLVCHVINKKLLQMRRKMAWHKRQYRIPFEELIRS